MAVGFSIDFLWYQIGTGDFLHSFFSTVCVRLEDGKWGSKYPYIMNILYQGKLEYDEVKHAKKELLEIQEKLKDFSPRDVVWDIDDLKQLPPWGDNISSDITNLSNYFVTSDGRDLIEVMFKVFEDAESEKACVEIINL